MHTILLLGSACISLWLFVRKQQLEQRLLGVSNDLTTARAKLSELAPYQSVIDIDKYVAQQQALAHQVVHTAEQAASELRRLAQEALDDAQRRAKELVAAANIQGTTEAIALKKDAQAWSDTLRREAEEVLASAKTKAAMRNERAEQAVKTAHNRAADIIDMAERRAQEIAGDAYQAVTDAARYEQVVRAMKNVIEGYGNRYIVPASIVLDELGEEFGYTEAGVQLKSARKHVRDMIEQGIAATCDDIESTRRETAINFMLDAFNGKCDSALADVRHDNFGTLQQKINDAYTLVNHHGRAFHDARIAPAFLRARIDELRWAVAVHELKQKEREEQRAIKERIRDEEKAQRDFERARKEAAKEEETLRKAMEKAQREIEQASEAQKAKYEAKLAELAGKLRSAEEQNKRAVSMAQQTKAGHVYVISNIGSFGEHVYKIGLTRRLDPLDRIRELGDASVPFSFDVHAMIRVDDAPALERELQKRFMRHQVNKVNPRKEFFRVPLAEIRKVADAMGIEASWTMAAASREYEETLAIEKSMASQTFDEAAWVERQLSESQETLPEPENDVLDVAS